MAIVVPCDRCLEELNQKGAIIFGPPMTRPDGSDVCDKYHLCVKCYEWLIRITTIKPQKQKFRKKK